MKRLLYVVAVMMLLAGFAVGQQVYYADSVTVAWDPVTQMVDGTPVTDLVGYDVYLKDGAQTVLARVTGTEYTIRLPDLKVYDVGVRAVRKVGTTEYYSEITWSSKEGKPSPFTVQRYPAPANVGNIRVTGSSIGD